MLMNPHFVVCGIEWNEIMLLIEKTHEVEKGGAYEEELIQIYPALYSFFFKRMATDNMRDNVTLNNIKNLVNHLIE